MIIERSLLWRCMMQTQNHWEKFHESKASDAVSWFQEHAWLSLELIKASGIDKDAAIIDIGGGASTLVDEWLVADITRADLPVAHFAVWHDCIGLLPLRTRPEILEQGCYAKNNKYKNQYDTDNANQAHGAHHHVHIHTCVPRQIAMESPGKPSWNDLQFTLTDNGIKAAKCYK